MTTASKRQKLHDLVNTADDSQLQAIYSIFEDQLSAKFDPWKDDEFVEEMNRRVDDYESGKTIGVPWDEIKLKAQQRSNTNK
jgi:hypothetical protein